MPQLGESVQEGTIARWLVKPGDRVVELDPMVVVDTDKVSAEVPVPVTGTLTAILAKEGESVSVGAEIALIEVSGEEPVPGARSAFPEEVNSQRAGSLAIAGDEQGAMARRLGQTDADPAVIHAEPLEAGSDSTGRGLSPAVRRLAESEHLDIAQVIGTGRGGRVTRKDVLSAVETRRHGGAPHRMLVPAAADDVQRTGVEGRHEGGEDEVLPLSRVRRLIADTMTQSKSTIPHASQTQEVDMSGVVANRNANKKEVLVREGFALTYLPYVVAAAVAGLRESRHVNATFQGDRIVIHHNINIGISVGLAETLLVPVIRHADRLAVLDIARAINDLATRARAGQLAPDDLTGATFTVNNSGTFGTTFSYSIINPGQAGILTMEAITERPVAVNGLIGIKPMMYLCFSLDHRVLDGMEAAKFLRTCRQWLEAVTESTQI